MQYQRQDNEGVIQIANSVYTFSIDSTSYDVSDFDFISGQTANGNSPVPDKMDVGSFTIIPFGHGNKMPLVLRKVLDDNNLAEGIFKRQRGLLWGNGPALYQLVSDDEKKKRKWVDDKEIEQWLKSFDYETYILNCLIEFIHFDGCFSKMYRNRGPRIGRPYQIAKLEHIGNHKCALEWPGELNPIKNVIVGDFNKDTIKKLTRYPLWKHNQTLPRVGVAYNNIYSIVRDSYPTPAWFGALNWIKRSSAIPQLLSSLTDNMLTVKFHIKSPTSYWDNKRDQLKTQCQEADKEYKESMLEDLKDEIFKQIGNLLSGIKNVGKFFTSETIRNDLGNLEEWQIEPIDYKVKDYIDSQIKISERADSATTSGLGLHPSLSNIMVDGKLASGSEQLYALKLYLASEVDIPERIILKALNEAIAINWPEKNIRLGFYREVIKTEDATTSSNRIKNAV